MAQRRMMSLHIIDTDAFMDMPHSSQCLYLHLLMRADDDGFVASVKKIMRMVGTQDDDLKILLMKRFVLPFPNGVCVIKHWRIHNYIQKDRYTPTKYEEELALLQVKSNGAYTMYTECIQNGDTGKVSIGKSKVSEVKDTSVAVNEDFETFWKAYPKKKGKGKAEESWNKLKPELSVVLVAIEKEKQTKQWQKDNGQFIPFPATWLNQKRWQDETEVDGNNFSKYDS